MERATHVLVYEQNRDVLQQIHQASSNTLLLADMELEVQFQDKECMAHLSACELPEGIFNLLHCGLCRHFAPVKPSTRVIVRV